MYHEENEVGRFYIFHLCFYINMNFRVVYWFYIKNHRLLFLSSLKILKCLSLILKFFVLLEFTVAGTCQCLDFDVLDEVD